MFFFWKIKRASWECVVYSLWYAQVEKWLETTCLLKQIASKRHVLQVCSGIFYILWNTIFIIYIYLFKIQDIPRNLQRNRRRQLQTSKASWRIARCGEISCKRVLDGHTNVSSTQKLERKRWLWGYFFEASPDFSWEKIILKWGNCALYGGNLGVLLWHYHNSWGR